VSPIAGGAVVGVLPVAVVPWVVGVALVVEDTSGMEVVAGKDVVAASVVVEAVLSSPLS
jgi:hypothetical protein